MIEEIVVSNFCRDYRKLTDNGRWEAVCLVGASYDFDNIFDESYAFVVTKEKDFEFQKVQNLIDERINQFWLGIKLGFIHNICLDDRIVRHYVVSNNEIIRCV